jgi:hypothetical protein
VLVAARATMALVWLAVVVDVEPVSSAATMLVARW